MSDQDADTFISSVVARFERIHRLTIETRALRLQIAELEGKLAAAPRAAAAPERSSMP
jgi:hypothetical protein